LPTDDADFCQIIAEFEVRLREQLAAMRAAFQSGDAQQLSFLAHWLKGSGGTAGFHEFTEPAEELSRLIKAAAPPESIADVLDDIELLADCIIVPPMPAVSCNR